MNIASRIRFYRESRGLSQSELARLLKMARPQLCRYEAGRARPGLVVLGRIARVLNVPIADFLLGQ